MNILFNIPAHSNCINCGKCCGIIPVTNTDIERIRKFVHENPSALEVFAREREDVLECRFRDNEARKCAIYPVRPTICRLFGVIKELQCENGNSANVNGNLFINNGSEFPTAMMNEIKW